MAVKIMAYGLRSAKRNAASEKSSIKTFVKIYKKNPATLADWNIIRAIAYSGVKK